MNIRYRSCLVVTLGIVATVMTQGCATRGFVRAQLDEMRKTHQSDTDSLQAQVNDNRNSTQEAQARAELAFGQAGEARDLALGHNGYQEAGRYTVSFAFGKDVLDQAAQSTLDETARQILDHPEYLVDVYGFTDSKGSARYNLALGQRRADAVMRYLTLRTPGMLSRYAAVSYGAEAPVADQSTKEGRAQNRRVVVSLVTKTRLPAAVSLSQPEWNLGTRKALTATGRVIQ
jgi:peptidoglycan-associated lipoprotein